jgi:hypothetical protein
MEYSLNDILEKFNNNDLDVKRYFNDFNTFFNILKKRGLMGEVDPKNAVESDGWQNEYLLWLYDNDKENYHKWIPTLLSDVIFENGKAYLEISDRKDLSILFCDGNRYDMSRDTIQSLLSDDGDIFEPYWDTTDDVYRDVIEELTHENDRYLQEYIVKKLEGQEISTETTELELIAAEQGHPEYVEVNMENIKRIIDDKESMNELLNDELSDLKSELYSIHSSAYNSAYEDKVWAEVWSELETYFEGHGTWITKPHPFKKNTEIQYFKIPIKNFESDVNDYLYNNKEYGTSGTLEYHGSYLGIMENDRDCLNARIPDYPDGTKVDKNINELFRDYI